MRQLAYAIALMIGLSCNPAIAQSQAQQDRIDQVARFLVTAPTCEHLGMKVDPDFPTKLEAAFKIETTPWAVDAKVVERAMTAALTRQSHISEIDLKVISDNLTTDAQLRGLDALYPRRDCLKGQGYREELIRRSEESKRNYRWIGLAVSIFTVVGIIFSIVAFF